MATLANLTVGLTARTAAFQKGMKRASATLKRFGAAMRRVGGFAIKWGGIMASAAAGGLALLVRQAFKTIDVLAKTSDKLGIATEDLTGLHHAAKLTGIEIRTFDMGLQRMIRRIAEAAAGTGEAQEALKLLGLDAKALNKVAPDEQFRRIADAMDRLENQADKVRMSFKLFDSEGVALVNILAMGRKGMDAAAEATRKYGTAITRIDAAKVEAANNAFSRAREVITGFARRIAVPLAPIIENIVQRFVDWAAAGGGVGQKVVAAMAAVGRALAWVVDRAQDVYAAFLQIQKAAIEVYAGARGVFGKGLSAEEVVDLSLAVGMLENKIAKLSDGSIRWSDTVGKAFEKIQAAARRAAEIQLGVGKGTGQKLSLSTIAEQMKAQEEAIRKLASRAASIFEQTRRPMERFWSTFDDLGTLLGKQLITWDTYARAVGRAKEQLLGTAQAAQKIGGTPALQIGTQQAISAERVHRMGARIDSMPADIHAALLEARRQSGILQEQNRLLVDLNAPAESEVLS